ncbi:Oligopeptide transporter 1 [Platanthera zijinensis]|uniref:Oligopeptide transporter 1 n=1 Tax=Platanthera zijinensis TaxID=2320716 RepID=A0AAP0FV30_9ASPA
MKEVEGRKYNLNTAEGWQVEVNDHPIEEVRLTVDPIDNPYLPVLTWRTWVLGVTSCVLLSFVNTFFGYRSNQLHIGSICAQIITLPIGRFLAKTLPNKKVNMIPFANWTSFLLNPGPFSMKEHCLITIFAGSGDGGSAIGIITIIKAFYHRNINPIAAFLLVQTTVVISTHGEALHLNENREKGSLTRFQFFIMVFIGSFAYYVIPGFLFPSVSVISILCLVYRNSITMHQIGSGLKGLGIGSFGLDWSTVVSFLGSPLATPATAIFNIVISYILIVYVLLPLGYWTNVYNAKSFPLISANVFDSHGQPYNISRIINEDSFTVNVYREETYGKLNITTAFALLYCANFAGLTATIMHVALHHGKDIWKMWKNTKEFVQERVEDVHSRLMKRNYEPVPQWWFLGVGLHVITEYIIGLMLPGKPLANVTFKTYSSMSMSQALALLNDLKLGHYMKIPPKSMFIVQFTGTMIAATVSYGTTWFVLDTVEHICEPSKLPQGSPWTCPSYNVTYNASIIWGLVGPMRMFGKLGHYSALNFFFLIGFLLPIPFWFLAKSFPQYKWLKYIHIPLLITGGSGIPPVHSVNYIMWGIVGIFFNHFVYKRHKIWWARHTYIMSAALEAGVAFMGILIFFSLQSHDIFGIDWWGGDANDHCPLATCPVAPGGVVYFFPIFPELFNFFPELSFIFGKTPPDLLPDSRQELLLPGFPELSIHLDSLHCAIAKHRSGGFPLQFMADDLVSIVPVAFPSLMCSTG